MTRAQPHRTDAAGGPSADGEPVPSSLTLHWRVGVEAARRVLGVAAERAGPPVRVGVSLACEPGGAWHTSAGLRLGGGEPSPLPMPAQMKIEGVRPRWTRDASRGLLHVDTPFLRATLDTSGAVVRVVYAASPLLASWGLSGGRYEVDGADVVFGAAGR